MHASFDITCDFPERCDFRTYIVIYENTALPVIIVSSLSLEIHFIVYSVVNRPGENVRYEI